jgi:amino acid permease
MVPDCNVLQFQRWHKKEETSNSEIPTLQRPESKKILLRIIQDWEQVWNISIITLVVVFGNGIFLSSGGVLATTGPAGCLLAYTIFVAVVDLNQMRVAECSSQHHPWIS